MRKPMFALAAACTVLTIGLGPVAPALAAPSATATQTGPTAAAADSLAMPQTLDDYRALVPQSGLPADVQTQVLAAIDQLPADHLERQTMLNRELGVDDSAVRAAISRAIDPEQYECAATPLDAYVDSLLADANFVTLLLLSLFGGLDLPAYDAVFFGHELPRSFDGGAENMTISHTVRDAKKFWDIPSGDIIAVPMTGSVYGLDEASQQRSVKVLTLMGGGDPENPSDVTVTLAELIRTLVHGDPALQGGHNPIFTLNAFAFSAVDEPEGSPFAGLSDRIAFGDGLFAALDAMGIDEIGPKAVLSHEFAHHVQYERDVFGDATGPEATRRTELMADGMAGYFSTHAGGLRLNSKRLVDVVRSFNYVGDCSFTSDGHHGTPNQRARAATWGVDLADSAGDQGHILPSQTVIDRFEEVLPEIVAPDAD